jgi:hypothetical protein
MAITVNNQNTGIDFRYIRDNGGLTGAAARDNAAGTSGKLYAIFVDNTAGSASNGYLKLYDTVAAVTNGTTVPDFEFRIVAAARNVFIFPEGLTFSNGLGYSASQGAGTTKGSNLGAGIADLYFVFK